MDLLIIGFSISILVVTYIYLFTHILHQTDQSRPPKIPIKELISTVLHSNLKSFSRKCIKKYGLITRIALPFTDGIYVFFTDPFTMIRPEQLDVWKAYERIYSRMLPSLGEHKILSHAIQYLTSETFYNKHFLSISQHVVSEVEETVQYWVERGYIEDVVSFYRRVVMDAVVGLVFKYGSNDKSLSNTTTLNALRALSRKYVEKFRKMNPVDQVTSVQSFMFGGNNTSNADIKELESLVHDRMDLLHDDIPDWLETLLLRIISDNDDTLQKGMSKELRVSLVNLVLMTLVSIADVFVPTTLLVLVKNLSNNKKQKKVFEEVSGMEIMSLLGNAASTLTLNECIDAVLKDQPIPNHCRFYTTKSTIHIQTGSKKPYTIPANRLIMSYYNSPKLHQQIPEILRATMKLFLIPIVNKFEFGVDDEIMWNDETVVGRNGKKLPMESGVLEQVFGVRRPLNNVGLWYNTRR